MIQLGEKIELEGFKELDSGELAIIRKLVGNFANKFGEFSKLRLHLKDIHKTENSVKFEINGFLERNGKMFNAEMTDYNVFVVINGVLDKLKKEIE